MAGELWKLDAMSDDEPKKTAKIGLNDETQKQLDKGIQGGSAFPGRGSLGPSTIGTPGRTTVVDPQIIGKGQTQAPQTQVRGGWTSATSEDPMYLNATGSTQVPSGSTTSFRMDPNKPNTWKVDQGGGMLRGKASVSINGDEILETGTFDAQGNPQRDKVSAVPEGLLELPQEDEHWTKPPDEEIVQRGTFDEGGNPVPDKKNRGFISEAEAFSGVNPGTTKTPEEKVKIATDQAAQRNAAVQPPGNTSMISSAEIQKRMADAQAKGAVPEFSTKDLGTMNAPRIPTPADRHYAVMESLQQPDLREQGLRDQNTNDIRQAEDTRMQLLSDIREKIANAGSWQRGGFDTSTHSGRVSEKNYITRLLKAAQEFGTPGTAQETALTNAEKTATDRRGQVAGMSSEAVKADADVKKSNEYAKLYAAQNPHQAMTGALNYMSEKGLLGWFQLTPDQKAKYGGDMLNYFANHAEEYVRRFYPDWKTGEIPEEVKRRAAYEMQNAYYSSRGGGLQQPGVEQPRYQ